MLRYCMAQDTHILRCAFNQAAMGACLLDGGSVADSIDRAFRAKHAQVLVCHDAAEVSLAALRQPLLRQNAENSTFLNLDHCPSVIPSKLPWFPAGTRQHFEWFRRTA